MATEYELQLRREAATTRLEELVDILERFIRGPVGETVDLGTGIIPTLQTIVGDLESSTGALNDHIEDVNEFLAEITETLEELP